MKVQVIGSSVDGKSDAHFASSYLIGSRIAIDAGSIGLISSLKRQRSIEHVFLSHSHIDHVASLPLFLDNAFQPAPHCPTVYGSRAVHEALRVHVFNDEIWPDLIRLSQDEAPFLSFKRLESGRAVDIGDTRITPIDLDHVVPTLGFVVEDATATIGIVSDTAPTEKIWQVLQSKENLKAVFLEAAFPNRMDWLAKKAMHLTPALFQAELAKLGRDVPVVAVHIKSAFHEETVRDLEDLRRPGLRIAGANQVFDLGDR